MPVQVNFSQVRGPGHFVNVLLPDVYEMTSEHVRFSSTFSLH